MQISCFYKSKTSAFTLIELLLVLSLLSVLALAIVPLTQLAERRSKEHALKSALLHMRAGIDAFKSAWEHDQIPKSLSLTGYPPNLTVLQEGLQLPSGQKIRFLKTIPRDPFFLDEVTANEHTWTLKSDQTGTPLFGTHDGVWDIQSRSNEIGLNGIPYAEW